MNVPVTSSEVFGFPVAPALELAGAVEQLRIASHGVIGGDGSMVKSMTGLLPVVERVKTGELPGPDDANMMQAQTEDFVPRMEPYVAVLEQFSNPRKAFVQEIGRVTSAIWEDAEAATERANEPELSKTRIANSISAVLGDLIKEPAEEARALPMLSGIVAARKQRPKKLWLPPARILAPVVPEIMTMLEAPLPKSRQHPGRIKALPETMIGGVINSVTADEMAALREAAPVLLTSVRDLLPTEGTEVTARFEAVKEFLQP